MSDRRSTHCAAFRADASAPPIAMICEPQGPGAGNLTCVLEQKAAFRSMQVLETASFLEPGEPPSHGDLSRRQAPVRNCATVRRFGISVTVFSMRRCGLPRWLPVLAAVGLWAPGCADDDDDGKAGEVGTTGADTGDDVGPGGTDTGTDESTDDGGEPVMLELESVFGVPNLDDDDQNGTVDWFELPFEGDNDVSALHVSGAPEGYRVEMTLLGDVEHIRVWHRAGDFIGHGGDPIKDSFSFEPGPEGTVLDVEFGEYNAHGVVLATLLDREGAEVESLDIELRASPLIMNHHLQPTEEVWVVELNGNGSMISDMEAVLGERLTKIPGPQFGHDVWIQDEIELATSVAADGTRLDTVIDSIRERGLGPYPKNHMQGPDAIARMWGSPANATTFDAFGNLEASPPVTVNGVEYPFGRIYYGREGNWGLDYVLADALGENKVQAPFEVDSAWLCVGHVDEFATFVPDPSSPKGFKFLFADIPSAYEILDGLDPALSLPRYAPAWPNGHGIGTVEGLTAANLRAYNEDIQALRLDPILEQFKVELGLDDSDIVLIPALFEHVGNCGTLALIPGTVNLLVSNVGDTTHLFIPDTFVRSDVNDQSSDPFVQDFAARMPRALESHFVDNWAVYHMYSGEVHCGINVRRTPMAEWFDTAMHLLEN
jgi:hypothetical protein